MPRRSSQFTVWLERVHSWLCVPPYCTLFLWHPHYGRFFLLVLSPTSSIVPCRSVELEHLHKLAVPRRGSQFTVWLERVHSWLCVSFSWPFYSTLFSGHLTVACFFLLVLPPTSSIVLCRSLELEHCMNLQCLAEAHSSLCGLSVCTPGCVSVVLLFVFSRLFSVSTPHQLL